MAASTSTISLVRLSFFRSEENVFAFTGGLEISFCFETEGGQKKKYNHCGQGNAKMAEGPLEKSGPILEGKLYL